MSNEIAFGTFTNLFVLGWLALCAGAMLSPQQVWRTRLLWFGGRFVPIVLLAVFAGRYFLWLTADTEGGFFSFDQVVTLFNQQNAVLNIWIELLALALLVGRWAVDDALKKEMPRMIVLPVLVVVFFSGGLGLLSYLVVSRDRFIGFLNRSRTIGR